MKKLLVLLLSAFMLFGLVACGNNNNTEGSGSSEGNGNVVTGYKVGVGSVTKVTTGDYNADEEKDGRVQYNTTYAGIVVDGEGKIVYLAIDTAQNTSTVGADGVVTAGTDTRSKKEKGADYGMVGASGIGKEWFEQIAALEEYAIGKTVEEVLAIPTYEKDESHLAVPTEDGDLATSVTITIADYLEAIKVAYANAVEVEGAATYGIGSVTKWSVSNYDAENEKDGKAQANTTFAMVALDADGKIVYVAIDTAQNSAAVDADGVVTAGTSFPTKKEKGADYGMVGASGIGKEWFEQIAALEEYAIGKTVAEFTSIPTYQRDDSHTAVPAEDGDLASSVTITVADYLEAVQKAADSAK